MNCYHGSVSFPGSRLQHPPRPISWHQTWRGRVSFCVWRGNCRHWWIPLWKLGSKYSPLLSQTTFLMLLFDNILIFAVVILMIDLHRYGTRRQCCLVHWWPGYLEWNEEKMNIQEKTGKKLKSSSFFVQANRNEALFLTYFPLSLVCLKVSSFSPL